MRDFFNFLKALIDADTNSTFGNVLLFNEQPDKSRKGQTSFNKRRSVYIHFIVEEVMNKSLGINDYDMVVRFVIANDNKKFSKLEDLDLMDTLNGLIQNKVGQLDDKFRSTSMELINRDQDVDHDQISESALEYSTKLTDFSGYRLRDTTEGAFSAISVSVDIVDSI